ncbi:hypothetical protein MPLSOD_90063 [Mesorhizobium sp. SOD10]|nr:hypothetical protein MPLSOD_90063 [Mesorhizobium sp. SOD10]
MKVTRSQVGSAERAAEEILEAASDHSGKADAHVIYAMDWLRSGREVEARAYVADILRSGRASPAMQALAADLINSPIPTRRRGRKVIERPREWMAIGSAFEAYRDQGMTYEAALEEVMNHFGTKKTSTENAINFYLRTSRTIEAHGKDEESDASL